MVQTQQPPRHHQTPNRSLLRSVLRENAMFSWLSGGAMAVFGAAIDTWVGLNQWFLIAGGIALIGYGVMIWKGAADDRTLAATGRMAVIGDVGWILASVAVVAATNLLTTNGEIALLLISVPVAFFAVGQAVGLRRLAA